MKDQLDIINTSFEKVIPKNEKGGFWAGLWQFLSLIAVLFFCAFYLLILNPIGWFSIVWLSLVYKFIISL
jgi:hypothetical protein